MQSQHDLSLNTDLESHTLSSGSAPPSASGSGVNFNNRKPIKSALKGLKYAPGLADGGRASPSPMPEFPRSWEDVADLMLMLLSPQGQYAHQLRLLQEEYASKATNAEMSQWRSLEKGKEAVDMRDIGAESQHGTQEMVVPARGRIWIRRHLVPVIGLLVDIE
jgi:hypothetical protein